MRKKPTFTDGPKIPSELQREIESASSAVAEAALKLDATHAAAKDAQRDYLKAIHVQEFFVNRAKMELNLKDGDKLNLQLGIAEILVVESAD